ncbi:MAG: DNA repair exonuclease [Gammaproteobacteria bacterium]|nr:DNA repair exonuclease [Gammaproteobacteria bacterium]
MKILAVGDIHLGRTPSRLPDELADRTRDLGPAGAWKRTVDVAIGAEVKAVLLAGDVVERENDFFEAYRELEQGVRRLTEDGIDVIGVAGNHDVKVLPRLARHIPEFRLLGVDGKWESCRIADGADSMTLWGWSFPRKEVLTSPLSGQSFKREAGINLGLLHCDRDAANSPYAPVGSRALQQAGIDGWLLGHIHKPDALSVESLNGYLGSLTGLDRSETGPHGPWLIGIGGGRIESVEQLPLAPLRWESIDVDLEGIGEPAEARGRVLTALKDIDRQITEFAVALDQPTTPDAVGVHIIFRGRTRFGAAVDGEFSGAQEKVIYTGTGNRDYFVQRTSVATRPERDLEDLAKQPSPPGLLAQRLLWLDEPEGHPDRDRLVAQAREALRSQTQKPVWNGLDTDDPDPAEWLRKAGLRALDQLLAQKDFDTV